MPKLTNFGVVGLAAFALYSTGLIAEESSNGAEEAVAEDSNEQTDIAPVFEDRGYYDRLALRQTGAIGLSDIAIDNSKGVFIQRDAFNATALDLSIRGIGGTTVNQATGESGVGVYVDGVFIPRGVGLGLSLIHI